MSSRTSPTTTTKVVFFLVLFLPMVGLSTVLSPSSSKEDDTVQREELGVNPITAPSIQELLEKLESFGPIPTGFLSSNPRNISLSNRFQTALHFGSLIADGFLLTIAEKQEELRDMSRALIRTAKSLDISDRLAQRGKSLLELSDKSDWAEMRKELIRMQEDVEQSIMELKDDVMADIVSLGGWLRGFQFACTVTERNYLSTRAHILADLEIIDYYIARLENLSPSLRKTDLVQKMTATLKKVREIASQAQNRTPTLEEIHRLKKLSDQLFADIVAPTNAKGNLLHPTKSSSLPPFSR